MNATSPAAQYDATEATEELLASEPTSAQIAAAQAFLAQFHSTTGALIALMAAQASLELDALEAGCAVEETCNVSGAIQAALPAIAAEEARSL